MFIPDHSTQNNSITSILRQILCFCKAPIFTNRWLLDTFHSHLLLVAALFIGERDGTKLEQEPTGQLLLALALGES
jgi:hypothetical protein